MKPGLDESHFDIEVPGFGDAVMHWVDVPNTQGNETRSGSSWVRYVEAERVADIAAGMVHDCPDISVGVITFYAKQREAIFAALEVKDICRKRMKAGSMNPPLSVPRTVKKGSGLAPWMPSRERNLMWFCCR